MCIRNLLRRFGRTPKTDRTPDPQAAPTPAPESAAPTPAAHYPYTLRDGLLSPAERRFYLALLEAMAGRVVICPKVRLADIFDVALPDPSENRAYLNKIDRKHVDFLLCSADTLRPLVGIELDDASHRRLDRQERDAFVDRVYAAAGLPLAHFRVKSSYSTAEIREHIRRCVLNPPTPENEQPEDSTPTCPKCGHPMRLRIARSGAAAGSQFWGCSNFPNCRYTLPLDERQP